MTLAAPNVVLVIVILQILLVLEMLVAPLAVIVLKALDPVLLQGMPGTEVDVTIVAVVGHEGQTRAGNVEACLYLGYLTDTG